MDTPTTTPESHYAAGVQQKPHPPHVGEMIERRLDAIGMTKAELGRRIGSSRQNVNSLIRNPWPPIVQIWAVSAALGYDFFAEMSTHLRAFDPRCTPSAPPAPPDPQVLSANLIRAAVALVNCALPPT